MTTRTEWTGTASELLGGLAEQVGGTQRKSKSWPNARRALAGRLRPAATFLRKVGIEVTFRREGRARTIRLRARKRRGATVRTVRNVHPRNYIIAVQRLAGGRRVDDAADRHQPDTAATARTKPLKSNAGTVADDADANGARRSGAAELRT